MVNAYQHVSKKEVLGADDPGFVRMSHVDSGIWCVRGDKREWSDDHGGGEEGGIRLSSCSSSSMIPLFVFSIINGTIYW